MISAIAKASASTSAHAATLSRRGARNRQRRRNSAGVVRPAEERHPPASHDAVHFKRRELETRDLVSEQRFVVRGEEVVAIVKPARNLYVEQ